MFTMTVVLTRVSPVPGGVSPSATRPSSDGLQGDDVGTDPITDQIPDPPSFEVTAGRGVPSDNTTLVEVLARYEHAGFTEQFGVVAGGGGRGPRVRCFRCRHDIEPEAMQLVSMRRMEGASDPDDMVAVVALRCPSCDARGTLALGYGPDSAGEEGDLLLRLEDLRGAEDPDVPADAAPGEVPERTGGGT